MKKLSIMLLGLGFVLVGCGNSEGTTETAVDTQSESSQTSEVETQSAVSTDAVVSNSKYIWPAEGENVTCEFECYDDHPGIDISSGKGSKVYAAASGTVSAADFDQSGEGYYIEIDHQDGSQTKYSHLAENFEVSVGDSVEQGQVIGYEGDSGNSTGEHLHFEIIEDGQAVDPQTYFA